MGLGPSAPDECIVVFDLFMGFDDNKKKYNVSRILQKSVFAGCVYLPKTKITAYKGIK